MKPAHSTTIVTSAAIRLLFTAMRRLFPCPDLVSVAHIHNGQGLKAEDREAHGTEDVFSSGGRVGSHTERMHSGPFVVIGRKGSAAKITYAPNGGWVTDTAYFATPREPVILDCKYLFYALKSLDFSDDIISTAIPGINRTAIYAHSIPHPTLDIQLAVVQFLDAIERTSEGSELPSLPVPISELGRVVARIEALAKEIFEVYQLRDQASFETDALWTSALRAAFLRSHHREIPLEQACSAIIDNLHTNPRYSDSGIPCIRSPDVGRGTLSLETALRTDEAEYSRRTVRGEPQTDDIVLVREGGGTGKAAIVLPNQRFSLGQRVMMLRPDKNIVLPKFFLYQILSPLIQDDHIAPLSKGSAAPHLNIGSLKRFPFRLPPLDEQRRLVAELEMLQAELETVKRLQAESAAKLGALLPSILSKAFAGELL